MAVLAPVHYLAGPLALFRQVLPKLFVEFRREFLDRIRPILSDFDFRIGKVEVRENGVVDARKTVAAYAAVLRRTQVLLNLPALTQVLVTKIYEAAACGAAAQSTTAESVAHQRTSQVRS